MLQQLSLITVLGLLVPLTACKKRPDQLEESFVKGELEALVQAAANSDVIGISTGCVVTTSDMERLPESMQKQISEICYVRAPRLYLEQAIAEARKGAGKMREIAEIRCMNLFVSDAFKTMKEHPSDDAELKRLATEYTRLCPKEVAKHR
jgi:hypothetical protein